MKSKNFTECLFNFLGDPEGLTREDLISELREQGIDASQLESRTHEIIKKVLEEARLGWLKRAQEKRAQIEELLRSRQIVKSAAEIRGKIKEVLSGNYGPQALSYAEAYFRKKEDLTENDLETLLQDLEDLNLLITEKT
jgi:hypothetical protein